MPAIMWPRAELIPLRYSVVPVYRNVAGPASIEGLSQVAASDAGLWRATFSSIAVSQWKGRRRIELWHAIEGLLEGRMKSILLPVPVAGRRPLPEGVTDDQIDCRDRTPHSDAALFSDGSGYETRWIETAASTNAARRATQITIAKTVCGEIAPGMRFSIDPMDFALRPIRLYQIKRTVAQSASVATVSIWPPLREPLLAGQALEWARPYVQMRLASDGEMNLTVSRGGLAEYPTVNFIEDL